MPHLSTIYFDLKLADPDSHRRWTGRDNATIHDNLRRLAALGELDLLVRVPLVPGVTDGPDNLRALAALAHGAGLRRLALLPYNPLWLGKRRALGLDMPYTHATWMSADEIGACRRVVEAEGVQVD